MGRYPDQMTLMLWCLSTSSSFLEASTNQQRLKLVKAHRVAVEVVRVDGAVLLPRLLLQLNRRLWLQPGL